MALLFNSAGFAVFFPLVCLAYFATPHPRRWITLLVASCIFYMAFIPAYIVVLAGLILIDYTAALAMEPARGRRRRAILVVSLAANVGMLGLFKYYNFAVGALHAPLPLVRWALPLGLSFHTFQSMAYTIEVYRERFPAERHLGRYALYVMFFPQLVAGPIERPAHLLPQFLERHAFDPERAADGLKLMAWGFFKKLVIADGLSGAVDAVYTSPATHHAASITAATLFFAVQIYCDFSGYTDIAIGAAEVIGFRLVKNFSRPYLARSIREFWSRWHISLSTWFRDYVYIPLGGNRVSPPRWAFNILLTFLISGLWHGANWTFIVWGALHGLYMVAGRATEPIRRRWRAPFEHSGATSIVRAGQIVTTFVLVSFGWVFFRAASLGDALTLLGRLGDWSINDLDSLGLTHLQLLVLSLATIVLFTIEFGAPTDDVRLLLGGRPVWVRWTAYYGLVTAVLLLGAFNASKFIYFQF